MPDAYVLHSTKTTGRMLSHLLLERDEYRKRWQRQQKRRSPTGLLNRHAVAAVIAGHLMDAGIFAESETELDRKLKDRVGRALDGKVLSPETLNWFVEAFSMAPEDERRLREAHAAKALITGIPLVDTLQVRQMLPVAQRHRTVMLFERRIIDAEGRAVAHHSSHTIVACEDGVDRYPCFPGPGESKMIMVHGGRVSARSQSVVEIVLPMSLRQGESTSFEYRRDFRRVGGPDTEYRRVVNARAQNIDIVVQFHPKRLPSRLWWSAWDHYRDGDVLEEELVTLDAECRAHRFLPYMENAAAGFRWEW
ncbi:hypothetical protein ACIBKY_24740 [Nonomuraea sp. NPDC050394]|uniref:hypothetical protein n=1 Tax=Nonomuraea sp. NPDC050394 TaxID=3364363 RepID=UPI00379A84DD